MHVTSRRIFSDQLHCERWNFCVAVFIVSLFVHAVSRFVRDCLIVRKVPNWEYRRFHMEASRHLQPPSPLENNALSKRAALIQNYSKPWNETTSCSLSGNTMTAATSFCKFTEEKSTDGRDLHWYCQSKRERERWIWKATAIVWSAMKTPVFPQKCLLILNWLEENGEFWGSITVTYCLHAHACQLRCFHKCWPESGWSWPGIAMLG